jgi:hypothetical protein
MAEDHSEGCEEREKLVQAYRGAQQDLFALEQEIGSLLVSPDRATSHKANIEIDKAHRRVSRVLGALHSHESKHRYR